MEEKKISYRTKRLLLTMSQGDQYSFEELVHHYNEVYPPPRTRIQLVIDLLVTRAASVRYRLRLLRKAGYVDRRLKPVLNDNGTSSRGLCVYFITQSGTRYLNDR